MDEIIIAIKLIEPIGVGVLLWRAWVADKERAVMLDHQIKQQEWVEGLVGMLLHQEGRSEITQRNKTD